MGPPGAVARPCPRERRAQAARGQRRDAPQAGSKEEAARSPAWVRLRRPRPAAERWVPDLSLEIPTKTEDGGFTSSCDSGQLMPSAPGARPQVKNQNKTQPPGPGPFAGLKARDRFQSHFSSPELRSATRGPGESVHALSAPETPSAPDPPAGPPPSPHCARGCRGRARGPASQPEQNPLSVWKSSRSRSCPGTHVRRGSRAAPGLGRSILPTSVLETGPRGHFGDISRPCGYSIGGLESNKRGKKEREGTVCNPVSSLSRV